MNWIATAFQELKAKVEKHIPHVNQSLTELDARVSGVETYTQAAVGDLDTRLKALEAKAAQ